MLRRNQRRGREFCLFKPVSMAAQVWRRSGPLFHFKQTSGRTTKQQQTTKSEAAARQEFTRLLIGRQQREMASTEKSTQFDPGGWWRRHYFPSRQIYASLCFSCFFVFSVFFCKISRSRYERRGEFSITDGSDWDAQTRCVNCCTRTGAT